METNVPFQNTRTILTSLADLSIRRPIFITCIVILMLVVGTLCMSRLPVDLLPNITPPVISVSVEYKGAGPREIETLVTRPLEDVIGTLPGITKLRSMSGQGRGVVIVEFNAETDIKYSEQLMRDRV
ncbi:MAG TPA: efflux RND transporter permease subunit, partial [Bdellovibrionales bacterium]|nr:efflux RND transporter permease subunit [Bdellovibrionales bacterium]